MSERHVLIVGGGLAGLSAGIYALANGYRTTIVEHNLALGGVCTAWQRGPYVIDGCIHWLTGGPFTKFYEELGILPRVKLRVLDRFLRYRDASDGWEIDVTRDLGTLERALGDVSPEDRDELSRIVAAARAFADVDPGVDDPPELTTLRHTIERFWGMRHDVGTLVHFRKPLGVYLREHIRSPRIRRLFASNAPEQSPAYFLLLVLGYLERGWLSRPVGGTAAFRDAIVKRYAELGGEVRTHATVDEILVEGGRVRGARLADGTMIDADVVISTSSTPETLLRLLAGRFVDRDARERLDGWKMFQPIVLASWGVASTLESTPPMMLIDRIPPFDVGGVRNERLYVRAQNDAPELAPPGHTVIQLLLETDYEWWAHRGSRYVDEKDAIASRALEVLDRQIGGVRDVVRVTDVATPLTYWTSSRSWRGAYEGWQPRADTMIGHVKKTLPGLSGFYMAGQWVEPGGGVPTACASGRQVIQLLCADDARRFATPASLDSGGERPHSKVA